MQVLVQVLERTANGSMAQWLNGSMAQWLNGGPIF
jgi:hypothetical protein